MNVPQPQTHPDSSDLAGRVALVTGGASGIGLATARTLARLGASVVVTDVSPPPDDLDARYAAADVSIPADWRRVIDGPIAELGGLDFALLNAGVQSSGGDVGAITDEEVERDLAINLGGVILGARACVPAMAGRGGAIVMTSSLAGLIAYAPDPLYAAAKHGVIGFARAVAPQYRERGVTVNVVCPALTDTAFLTDDQRHEVQSSAFPLIPVQDVADAIMARFLGGETGGVWVCQFGREPIRYEPRGVPGPAGGAEPPAGLAQALREHDR